MKERDEQVHGLVELSRHVRLRLGREASMSAASSHIACKGGEN